MGSGLCVRRLPNVTANSSKAVFRSVFAIELLIKTK